MKRTLPRPCKYLKGDYCSVRAKIITQKDGSYRECIKCPTARRS